MLSIAFYAYAIDKERHLQKLSRLLTDERVLTAALSNCLRELSLLLQAGKAMSSPDSTPGGVSALAGDVSSAVKEIRAVGYVPSNLPDDVDEDERYDEFRLTDGERFSPLEPLTYWPDLMDTGVRPADVGVVAVGARRLTGLELRIALPLGARVAVSPARRRSGIRPARSNVGDGSASLTGRTDGRRPPLVPAARPGLRVGAQEDKAYSIPSSRVISAPSRAAASHTRRSAALRRSSRYRRWMPASAAVGR